MNVIRGNFLAHGDAGGQWAVLCRLDEDAGIFVFRDGSGAAHEVVGRRPLQYAYNREIRVADAGKIGRYLDAANSDIVIERDGIEDMYVEVSSRIWYKYGDEWRILVGAD